MGVIRAVRGGPPAADLKSALRTAAALPPVASRLPPGAAVTVKLSADAELRRLNRDFLGHDEVTDVLAFPAGETAGDEERYLGDIVVSWPRAQLQGEGFGYEPAAEVQLLAVHGFLHLLGWDHAVPAEEAEMTGLTTAALAQLGIMVPPGRLPQTA